MGQVAAPQHRTGWHSRCFASQTDPRGSERHNDQLGLERARVVAEYLKGRGVPEGETRVRSRGELASAQSQELWPVERKAGVDVTP